jgi:hypothetical protein
MVSDKMGYLLSEAESVRDFWVSGSRHIEECDNGYKIILKKSVCEIKINENEGNFFFIPALYFKSPGLQKKKSFTLPVSCSAT